MISSLDTTNVDHYCPNCATTDTIALSGLEAGIADQGSTWAARKNAILLPACSSCGYIWFLQRTFANPTKEAGAVNSLHRYLVDTAAQTNSDWTSVLNAEGANDKPAHYYTVSASPLTFTLGTNGRYPYDLDVTVTLLGPTESKVRLEDGRLYTDQDDSTIATFVAALYAAEERTANQNELKARRLSEYSI